MGIVAKIKVVFTDGEKVLVDTIEEAIAAVEGKTASAPVESTPEPTPEASAEEPSAS